MSKGNFGIVVSGGPAPGINGVISAAVVEAMNNGYKVKGFVNGFKGVCESKPDAVIDLSYKEVSQIYKTGGSILGTSRYNPFNKPDAKAKFRKTLDEHAIDKLIVIGGEGSAFLTYSLSVEWPDVQVVHVPKTIDNDLVLPHNHPSFGFETARYAGARVLDTLMVDAKTCNRWFIITTMGRSAGFLALGLGIASGAHITLIPEEFKKKKITPADLAAEILPSIQKRLALGKQYGVALLAEGIIDCLDPQSTPLLKDCPHDDMGRIRYSQLEVGDIVIDPLKALCKENNLKVDFYTKSIGYELRCHPPVSFDVEYTRFLGYGAVKLILDGKTGVMVTKNFDAISFETLKEMRQEDGTIRGRRVDLSSDLYQIAKSFMIR